MPAIYLKGKKKNTKLKALSNNKGSMNYFKNDFATRTTSIVGLQNKLDAGTQRQRKQHLMFAPMFYIENMKKNQQVKTSSGNSALTTDCFMFAKTLSNEKIKENEMFDTKPLQEEDPKNEQSQHMSNQNSNVQIEH